jgi:superfamily II DNA helicase RecQ
MRQSSAELAAITDDLPEQPVAKSAKAKSVPPADDALIIALKKWRLDRARSDGVSAFIVAHNSLLEAIAQHRPSTPSQLLGLSGFGSQKLEKYGNDILLVIALHQSS